MDGLRAFVSLIPLFLVGFPSPLGSPSPRPRMSLDWNTSKLVLVRYWLAYLIPVFILHPKIEEEKTKTRLKEKVTLSYFCWEIHKKTLEWLDHANVLKKRWFLQFILLSMLIAGNAFMEMHLFHCLAMKTTLLGFLFYCQARGTRKTTLQW